MFMSAVLHSIRTDILQSAPLRLFPLLPLLLRHHALSPTFACCFNTTLFHLHPLAGSTPRSFTVLDTTTEMRTFAIVLASLPALVLGQFDSLGLQSSTTPTSLASPPSVLAIPSLTESETLCRTEATPCSTTTTAAGLLDILRRDEVSKDGADIVPTPTGTLPESAVLEQVDALSSTLSVKRRHIFRDRDLGLPVLPGVLDATSSEAAPNTTRLPDSEVTPEAIQAIPPFAQKDTAHTTTIAANLKSTFTSYPSPKVTKTDFPFDSAAANGRKCTYPTTESPDS